jgi:hypothetical protein
MRTAQDRYTATQEKGLSPKRRQASQKPGSDHGLSLAILKPWSDPRCFGNRGLTPVSVPRFPDVEPALAQRIIVTNNECRRENCWALNLLAGGLWHWKSRPEPEPRPNSSASQCRAATRFGVTPPPRGSRTCLRGASPRRPLKQSPTASRCACFVATCSAKSPPKLPRYPSSMVATATDVTSKVRWRYSRTSASPQQDGE